VAVELVREIWCDIDLKKNKTKVEAKEAVATVVHEGKFIKIDTCEGCFEKLTFAEIIAFGDQIEPPHAEPRRMGAKIRTPPPSALKHGKGRSRYERTLVQCSVCGRQMTSGSGWGLHNNAHIRRGVNNAEPVPVV
jgi:ribosomal protein S27E